MLAAGALYATSAYRLSQTYDVTVEDLPVFPDPATVARGRHVAVTRSCGNCHGSALAGSTAVDNFMIGTLRAPNLPPGGVGGTYTDTDRIRALRHGVAPDGTPLVFMPS